MKETKSRPPIKFGQIRGPTPGIVHRAGGVINSVDTRSFYHRFREEYNGRIRPHELMKCSVTRMYHIRLVICDP